MLFRTSTGGLIEIKKYDFSTDKLYYKKIIEIKSPPKQSVFSKSEKTFNNINK